VHHSTVQADLADKPKSATKAERRAQRELELASKQTALPVKRYGVSVAVRACPPRYHLSGSMLKLNTLICHSSPTFS
jgi:hypothetical protein